MLINSAFADVTTDARIQAYKANRLIPQNVVLPTTTNAEDSQEVVFFNSSGLSWNSDTAANVKLSPLSEKYKDWTMSDFITAFGDFVWEDPTAEHEEMRQYLSAVGNNKLSNENISASEALSQLQSQFEEILNLNGGTFGNFPCEGLDFSNLALTYIDMSNWTGVTAEQLMACSDLSGSTLPNVAFTGNEDFTGKSLFYTNLSGCTGITGEQIVSAGDIEGATLPAIAFTGEEDFSGVYLYNTDLGNCSGITGKQFMDATVMSGVILPQIVFTGEEDFTGKTLPGDVTMCVGITPSQIAQLDDLSSTNMTSQQYTEWYDALMTKFSGFTIYVDYMQIDVGDQLP